MHEKKLENFFKNMIFFFPTYFIYIRTDKMIVGKFSMKNMKLKIYLGYIPLLFLPLQEREKKKIVMCIGPHTNAHTYKHIHTCALSLSLFFL